MKNLGTDFPQYLEPSFGRVLTDRLEDPTHQVM